MPWVVRSIRDWALAARQGLALVTYRSSVTRSLVIEQLTGEFQRNECSAETLQCANCTAEEFVFKIGNSHADILFVLDLDRLLFGENNDRSPFWINFHRETIVGHSGVQIWWLLPNAAVRFGQQLPDLSRFFLFREELLDQDEIEQHAEKDIKIPTPQQDIGTGDATLARDLLGRALRAASGSRVDPGRIWLELGVPALIAFLRTGKTLEAADALKRLGAAIGAPEEALKPLTKTPGPRVGWAYQALGHLYRALYRLEDALAATNEAAGVYRALAKNDPAILPSLAGALTNLANRFTELGRPELALSPAAEAVRIRRQLVERSPLFLSELAVSLNNLAEVFTDLGRREEALAHEEEAVRIYRQPLPGDPDAFLPSLGGSLGSLANKLSDLGRPEEALAAAQEAAQIYRRLSQGSVNGFFLPGLAASLDNLANRLGDLGYLEEALGQAQEAVALRRQLAHEDPDAFLPDLARSLSNTANKLSRLNRPQEALPLAEESVKIRRDLANNRPDAFLPELATSLNNLANTLGMLNRDEEALANAEVTVEIRRELAKRYPDAFLPDLAVSLNTLANRLSALGRQEEAIVRADEVLEICRRLAQQNPETFVPELARTLAIRGMIVAEDHPSDAMKFLDEAIRLLLPLYLRHPLSLGALIQSVRASYLQTARSAGVTPDPNLLAK